MKIIKLFLPLSLLAIVSLNLKALEVEEEVGVEVVAPQNKAAGSDEYNKLEKLINMHQSDVDKWLTMKQKYHHDKFEVLKRTLKDKADMMKKYLPRLKDKPELVKEIIKDKLALSRKHANMWKQLEMNYANSKKAEAEKQAKELSMLELER